MQRPVFKSILLVLFVFASCTSESDPSNAGRSPSSGTTSVEPGSDNDSSTQDGLSVLYLDKRTIKRYDVANEQTERLGELPSVDASASAEGEYIAYVTSADPSLEDEDFIVSPELHLYEVASGRDSTVGPGFSPLWHPDGDRLAYLEPTAERACEGETCEGTASLQLAEIEASERTTLLNDGAFVPLAWLGENVVVSQQGAEPVTLAVPPAGPPEKLDIEPSEFWGASPDGEWTVRSIPERMEFVSVNGPEHTTVTLEEAVLGEGAWSPDSERIAAVLLKKGGGSSRLVLSAPAGRATEVVDGSRGAAGPVLWAPDSSAVLFTRSVGPGGLSLEAVVCELGAGGSSCSPLFSWPREITLLALF